MSAGPNKRTASTPRRLREIDVSFELGSAADPVGRIFYWDDRVFRPARRPWVDILGADTAAIVRQVERCPSGALSCFRNGEVARDGSHSKVGFKG